MAAETATSKFTPPGETIDRYADFLKSLSLCVDYSVHPPTLLYANSRIAASPEVIMAKFKPWARKHSIRVADFHGFSSKLVAKVKERLPIIFGTAFKPVNESFFEIHEGIAVANTFVPFLPLPAPPAPEVLTEYFERLFANDDDRHHVLQFFGHAFQHPLIRPQHGLLITGDQGNGKSTLPTVLRKAMGGKHVFSDNSYASAFTEFAAYLPDNAFVIIDDGKANIATHGRLKLEITRKQQWVNVKYQVHPVERDVYARMLVLNNEPTPMVMDNCRRFYATEFATHTNKHNPEGTKANTDAFFDRFFEWFDTPLAAAQLRQFFLAVKLDGSDGKKPFNAFSIPQTPTLMAMIDSSRSVLGKLIERYVEDLPCFHMNQLYTYLKANNISSPNLDAIEAVLRKLKYGDKRRVVPGCGDAQVDIWVPPPPPGKKNTRKVTELEAEAIARAVGNFDNAT
jgi:hypothetical protein